jgi:hypothetical protein
LVATTTRRPNNIYILDKRKERKLKSHKRAPRKERIREIKGRRSTIKHHEFRGSSPKEKSHPFPLMSKGERNIRSMMTWGVWSMSVAINDKGGDCWKFGCH